MDLSLQPQPCSSQDPTNKLLDNPLTVIESDTGVSTSHARKLEPSSSDIDKHDLVGGPFAVIESDPGVFTSLARKLGVLNTELVELLSIDPWAVDHLRPLGLILCFLWRRDASPRPSAPPDPAAARVWFANQLSDDACASHALLNVLLNCPAASIDIGDTLRAFRADTEGMDPVMRGLAVTNSPLLRKAHNSLARPADIRGALNTIATTTLKAARKPKPKPIPARGTKPPPAKRARTGKRAKKDDDDEEEEEEESLKEEEESEEEAYHFIGYVPAYGKVWELDGLKAGPLEVGELPAPDVAGPKTQDTGMLRHPPEYAAHAGWMDVVRPALRLKMSSDEGVRFSLLAIVASRYQHASDALAMAARARAALERRMEAGWETQVDAALLVSAQIAFAGQDWAHAQVFATDFGAQRMAQDLRILGMPVGQLQYAWEACIREAVDARTVLDEELAQARAANMEHIKRTFDYEPFLKAFVEHLGGEGLLGPLLNLDEGGSKRAAGMQKTEKSKSKAKG